MSTTQNARDIKASPEALYKAFIDPAALEIWLAPGEMTGKIHSFNPTVGGGYQMSLYYPQSEKESKGKTAEKEDRFTARFVELVPYKKIVEAITFDSSDKNFAGEMIMDITLQPKDNQTSVIFLFKNNPPGIKPADNENRHHRNT